MGKSHLLESREVVGVVVVCNLGSTQSGSQHAGAAAGLLGVEGLVEDLLRELGQLNKTGARRCAHNVKSCVRVLKRQRSRRRRRRRVRNENFGREVKKKKKIEEDRYGWLMNRVRFRAPPEYYGALRSRLDM